MTTSDLRKALLACAAGFYPHEAGVGLLITHASFLDRSDFTGAGRTFRGPVPACAYRQPACRQLAAVMP